MVVFSEEIQSAELRAINSAIGSKGSLELQDVSGGKVAVIRLQNPAFSVLSSKTIGLAGAPLSVRDADGGRMAKFQIKADGRLRISGSVGVSNEDINFPEGVDVDQGDTVIVSDLVIETDT